jgi:hypothetical protein
MTPHFKTNSLKVTLEPRYFSVLKYFDLSAPRLLCFFDDENPPCFARRFPSGYRGFCMRVKNGGDLPPYIDQLFFDRGAIAFDRVIYIPGSTCATETGFVITFAHELQHFKQEAREYKALVANRLLCQHLRTFEPLTSAKPWNLPHEHGAMSFSKYVAEAVLGVGVVSDYAASRISNGDDALYWEYFQGLAPQASFDLLQPTIPLVNKYCAQLCKLQQSEVDFSKSEWWK